MPHTYQLGDRRTDEKTGAIMVYVPAGKFMMGSDNGDSDERPVHEQFIAQSLWLDLTPVTNAAYAKFVADGGYRQRELWTAAGWAWREKGSVIAPQNYDGFTAPNQPRVGISWYEVWAFAAWRGGRLPTEAEWEWAARGPENRVYPWGNSFVDDLEYVIYHGNSGGKTHPVGEGIRIKGAAWCGALDMSGNVWEWVSSVYEPYPYRADDGRETRDGTDSRGLRGGSWYYDRGDARAAFRSRPDPDFRGFNLGVRVAVSAPVR
ncbi:MAG: formylglycine-generating enzyme family protein [Chloroflexi bacterium CFX4]|nr:formylglycine-generating enzyme family protein [Chloroflexi bacterium CFX4]MDL1922141.1 formylglycine-generating enzyme family protein [Chloroflexi bacterium CFX3]